MKRIEQLMDIPENVMLSAERVELEALAGITSEYEKLAFPLLAVPATPPVSQRANEELDRLAEEIYWAVEHGEVFKARKLLTK